MSTLSKKLFEKYANLKIESKAIDREIEKLAPVLKAEMEKAGKDEVESSFGKFTISKVPVWHWPKEIIAAEERIEKMKIAAKRTGKAKHTDRKDFKFNPSKDE